MCVRFAIKTLQQELVHVELGEEASVRELKVALCTPPRDGWRAAAQIKLVCNGKPLGDEESLVSTASYLREDAARFIVAIVRSTRPSAAPPPAVASPSAAAAAVRPAASPAAATSAVLPAASPAGAAAAVPAAASADDAKLTNLVEMGFERAAAEHALAAAAGDVARAVDALMTRGRSGGSSSGGSGGSGSSIGSSIGSSGSGSSSNSGRAIGRAISERIGTQGVQELGRAARASAVARDLQADPRMLAMLLRMPEVQRLLAMPRLEGIQHRPDELQRLLRRVLLRPELQQAMKAGTVSDAMIEEALRPEGEGWDAAPGNVTPASRAERFVAIAERRRRLRDAQTAAALEQQLGDADDEAKVGRLMELVGQRVSRQRVIEAFLACDKDESLAASLLLAQLDE